MRVPVLLRTSAALLLALGLGCSNGGEDRVLGIGTTGEVRGLVKVDANGSRELDLGDDSLPGIRVHLVVPGGSDTGLVVKTLSDGSFRFRGVPVGVYTLRLDSATFGDSLRTVKVDSASFTVEPDDTVLVNALAGLALFTTAEVRALPAGRRVFVAGVALNDVSTYADTTVHVRDAAGYLRIARLGCAAASLLIGYTLSRRGLSNRSIGIIMGSGAGALLSAIAYDLVPECKLVGPGIFLAFGMNSAAPWGMVAISGLITLVLGAMILAHWPLSSLYVLGIFLSVDLICAGVSWISMGMALKQRA